MSITTQIYVESTEMDLDQFINFVTGLFDMKLFGTLDDFGEINFALSIDKFRVNGAVGMNNYSREEYSYLLNIRYISIEDDPIKQEAIYKESGNLIFHKLKEINKYPLLLVFNFGHILDEFMPESEGKE